MHLRDFKSWTCAFSLLLSGTKLFAQIESHWTNVSGGNWTEGANWSTSPDFPNNNGTLYHAFIDLVGPAYTVGLGDNVAVSAFTLNSASATVAQGAGVFRVLGNANLAAGTFRLDGGTIDGGTWNLAGGNLAITANTNNRIRGLTLNGNLTLDAPDAKLKVADGLNMAGMLTLGAAGAQITSENTQTFSGGTLRFDPISAGNKSFLIEAASVTTFSSTQRVNGGRGVIGGLGSLVNEGYITADAAEQSLVISPQSFENRGAVECRNGGALTIGSPGSTWVNSAGATITAIGGSLALDGNWTNQSTITVAGSNLSLGGTFSTQSLAGLVRIGGTIDLTGRLQNQGADFSLNTITGSWNLAGGQIQGGRLLASGGAKLVLQQNSANLLDGVIVGDALDFSAGGWVRATTGTTFTTPLTLNGAGARLGLDVGRTLVNQTINLGGSSSSPRQLSAEGNGDLVLDSGCAILGTGRITSGLFTASPNARIINQGRISNNGAGVLEIGAARFRNEGLIEASAGGTVRLGWDGSQNTPWVNAGVLRTSTNASLQLSGRFSTADIGTIERSGGGIFFNGVLDNTGSVLDFNASTGSWEIANGTIRGGTINTSATAGLIFRNGDNYLDGVTYNGDIALGATSGSGQVHFSPTSVLNGVITGGFGGATVKLDVGGTYDLNITAQGSCGLAINGVGTVTLGSNFSLQTLYGSVTADPGVTLINRGSILATGASGSSFVIRPTVFRNEGALRATASETLALGQQYSFESPGGDVVNAASGVVDADGGTVLMGGRWINHGVLRVRNNGTLNLAGEFRTGGIGTIDRQGGTVRLSGSLDNLEETLRLDETTGVWLVKYGKITGGVLDLSAGPYLRFESMGANNPHNEFHDVDIVGNFNLTGSNGAVFIYGGLNAPDGTTLAGDSSIAFAENTTLRTPIVFDGYRDPGNGEHKGYIGIDGNTVVINAAGNLIRGRGGVVSGGYGQFENDGIVRADLAGLPIHLGADRSINRGLLEATNGGALWFGENSQGYIEWMNSASGIMRGVNGTIGVAEYSQDIRAVGTNEGLIEATGGTLQLGGVWTNTGVISASGGATATLGSYSASENRWTNSTLMDFRDVVLAWDKNNSTTGGVNAGEIRLTHTSGRIDAPWRNDGILRLADSSTVRIVPSKLRNLDGTTFTGGEWIIGPNCALNMDSAAILINAADILLDGPNSLFPALSGLRENRGELALSGGRDLTLGAITNFGALQVGAGSVFSVTGAFAEDAAAQLLFVLDGPTDQGVLTITQNATLAGAFGVELAGGYAPQAGDSFNLVVAAGINGTFGSLALPVLPGGLAWELDYSANTVSLSVIPEPSNIAVLLLVSAGWAIRRRR